MAASDSRRMHVRSLSSHCRCSGTHTHTHHTPHTTHHTCLTTRQSPGTHCTGHCLLGLIQSYCDSIHQNAWVAAWVQEFPEPTPPATRGFGAIHPPNPRVFGVSFSGRAGRRSSEGQREGSTCHDGPPEMGSTWYSCSGLKPEGATRRREGEKDEGRERKHALSETWASREPYQLHRRRLGPSRGPRSRRG